MNRSHRRALLALLPASLLCIAPALGQPIGPPGGVPNKQPIQPPGKTTDPTGAAGQGQTQPPTAPGANSATAPNNANQGDPCLLYTSPSPRDS